MENVEPSFPLYIVLSPTRELAQQTHKVFNILAQDLGLKSISIIGGENIEKQKELILEGAHVLVATPGRLVDLAKRRDINFSKCKGIVFDEADRLFDMGFQKDIEFVLRLIPQSRQLIMVSATSNQDVLRVAYKFHSEPEEIKLNEDSLLVEHLDHHLAMMEQAEKFPYLVKLLRDKEDAYTIVFCNTQFQTHLVAEWLRLAGFKAMPISGSLSQNKRTKLLADFRAKEITTLVCTDVAARGLDIKDVNLVVNYDLPSESANYVHRIGRTGRAGQKGIAISLCAYEDCDHLEGIYKVIESKIPKLDIKDDDFATDVPKKPYIDSKTLRPRAEKQLREKSPRKKQTSKTTDSEKTITNKEASRPKTQNPPVEKKDLTMKTDTRTFITTNSSLMTAQQEAIHYFNLKDNALLGHDILEKGRRKFLIVGPRTIKYKFFIKPIFKKILLPYLIELMKKAHLEIYVKVFYKEPNVKVIFSGKDEGLLRKNGNELLRAFESIIKLYVMRKVTLKPGTKIHVELAGSKNSSRNNERNNERNSERSRKPRHGENSTFQKRAPMSAEEEKAMEELAKELKQQVINTGSPAQSEELTPAQRRIIHQYLDSDQSVTTTSLGDGRLKRVEINLKNG